MMAKKKYALVTINIGKRFDDMGELTIPFMKKYADKIKTDFVTINKSKQLVSQYSAYWAKFQLFDLLDHYDRLFYLDLDTLVYPHCPNIFQLVPGEKLGVLMESDYSHQQTEEILELQYRVKDINWRKGYFNVGVMVISKVHREILNIQHGNDGGKKFPEQTQINYNVQRFKIPIFKLNYKFNHMYFCGNINNRANSYIFHYAGINHEVRTALIREDIQRCNTGKPPVQLEEFGSFFETHFPEKDISRTMMVYKLFKDSEI